MPSTLCLTAHRCAAAAAVGDEAGDALRRIGRVQRLSPALPPQKRLGLSVLRTWAFNDRLPFAPGAYDSSQLAGLDYVVAAVGWGGAGGEQRGEVMEGRYHVVGAQHPGEPAVCAAQPSPSLRRQGLPYPPPRAAAYRQENAGCA